MKCSFIKIDVKKCNANALRGRKMCFFHSPDDEVIRKRSKAQVIGGKNKGYYGQTINLSSLDSLEGILQSNAQVINSVGLNSLPPNRANCIGYLLNIQLKVIEIRDVQAKLIKFEEYLSKKGKPL